MKDDRLVQSCLLLMTIAAMLIALRPLIAPSSVRAQDDSDHRICQLQFEPGTTMIRAPGAERQVIGKIAYDTCTGKVWGFPTTTNAPYPVDNVNPGPPTYQPIYLGKYGIEATQK